MMINIKGVAGPKTARITTYCITIGQQLNPLLIHGLMWKVKHKILGLEYDVTSDKNGNIKIVLGNAATKQITTLDQVKKRAHKILLKLSGYVESCILESIKFNNPELINKAIQGSNKAVIKLRLLYEEYENLADTASESLYLAALLIKDCDCELE